MEEFDKDYTDLLNTVQRHTKCNSAYCLKTDKNGDQYCRFNFPFEKNESTHVKFEKLKTKNGESNFRASIVSKRNDPRVNRHQRLQLQAWRANCDIQLILDHHACIEYLAKYASKGENMSSVVRDAFVSVVNKLTDESDPKVAVRKLMMKAVGERDMSMQEVMHQILSLKLFSSSFNVITVSLDGSRKCKVESNFFFFFFYELKLMYICLFTRAKSGREMTDCILSLPLMTVTDKHLCNISSKKEEKILQSLR